MQPGPHSPPTCPALLPAGRRDRNRRAGRATRWGDAGPTDDPAGQRRRARAHGVDRDTTVIAAKPRRPRADRRWSPGGGGVRAPAPRRRHRHDSSPVPVAHCRHSFHVSGRIGLARNTTSRARSAVSAGSCPAVVSTVFRERRTAAAATRLTSSSCASRPPFDRAGGCPADGRKRAWRPTGRTRPDGGGPRADHRGCGGREMSKTPCTGCTVIICRTRVCIGSTAFLSGPAVR